MSFNSIAASICSISLLTASLLYSLPSQASKTAQKKVYPTSGKLLQLTNGDLMCYVEIRDARGKKHSLGAVFEICEQSQLLNKQVQLNYKPMNFNDCQSIEPCGKTKVENAIVKMKLLRRK